MWDPHKQIHNYSIFTYVIVEIKIKKIKKTSMFIAICMLVVGTVFLVFHGLRIAFNLFFFFFLSSGYGFVGLRWHENWERQWDGWMRAEWMCSKEEWVVFLDVISRNRYFALSLWIHQTYSRVFSYSRALKVKGKVTQSCPTLFNPMNCIVHGILQARILEWVAFPFSRGSSQPRDWTQVSHIAGRFFTSWVTREAQEYWSG